MKRIIIVGVSAVLVGICLGIGLFFILNKDTDEEVKIVSRSDKYRLLIDNTKYLKCSQLNNIKYMTGSASFITNDNYLYRISNNKCEKVSDIEIRKYVDTYYVDYYNNVYKLVDGRLKEIDEYDFTDYLLNDEVLFASRPLIYYDIGVKMLNYYVLKLDGKIYLVTLKEVENVDKHYFEFVKEEVYFDKEDIRSYSLGNNYNLNYILTDNNFYIDEVIDKECYSDKNITCEYELKLDNYFSNNVSKMSFIKEVSENEISYYDVYGNYYIIEVK